MLVMGSDLFHLLIYTVASKAGKYSEKVLALSLHSIPILVLSCLRHKVNA